MFKAAKKIRFIYLPTGFCLHRCRQTTILVQSLVWPSVFLLFFFLACLPRGSKVSNRFLTGDAAVWRLQLQVPCKSLGTTLKSEEESVYILKWKKNFWIEMKLTFSFKKSLIDHYFYRFLHLISLEFKLITSIPKILFLLKCICQECNLKWMLKCERKFCQNFTFDFDRKRNQKGCLCAKFTRVWYNEVSSLTVEGPVSGTGGVSRAGQALVAKVHGVTVFQQGLSDLKIRVSTIKVSLRRG